uniref:Major facilitator superfamily (MFS) profile domain-containing protein n=1 Tax=Bionectria ochroleuca TaxID=29856 RepID=A0A0B7KHD1_BIOOC
MAGSYKSDTTRVEEPSLENNSDQGGRTSSNSVQAQINQLEDIESLSRFEEETADRGIGALHHIRSRTRSRTNETLIDWAYNDPENPYNWPMASVTLTIEGSSLTRIYTDSRAQFKKNTVTFLSGMLVINSTMNSALPSMAIPFITKEFGITSSEQKVLPISIYLVGYVLGPIVWGPLSEHVGRRYLSICTFAMFSIFTMACGFSPNWSALLVFRFFCGMFGSAPIAVVAGILADVYGEPRTRGRAFAIFMVTTVFGPLFAPIVSGFCSTTIGWRWTFWIGVFFAAATLVMVLFLPETYGPILLARRARRMRAEDPASRAISPRDLEETDLSQLFTVVLTRPIRMLLSEPIVSTTCAYLALVYAIFYMSFQAFPIIFSTLYGLSPGVTGLCYLPIGGGATLSLPIFCGLSFVVPMLAGIPFGLGFMLIFMALLNYLTDAYDIFAASANAAASCCRSLLAVVLPLATSRMFDDLGISGACALLGGLSAGMCVIPFVFIWKGPVIREKSKFCIALRERREEIHRRAERERERLEGLWKEEKGTKNAESDH